MAIIDKLTAIADAIRGKTGKTDGLTLEQMATEISDISVGSQIVTGTFTKTTEYYYYNSITVSGIPFKPSYVIAYSMHLGGIGSGSNRLFLIDNKCGAVLYENGTNIRKGDSYYSITSDTNGFKINILASKDSNGEYNNIAGGTWNYIAIS